MNTSQAYNKAIGMILALALAAPMLAQHNLTGRVSDRQEEPLSYATVALMNPADSILVYDHEH